MVDERLKLAEIVASEGLTGTEPFELYERVMDARLTFGAASLRSRVGIEQPLELMTRAGHRSMATTRQYLHLAGVTFPEKAAALEQHLLGGRTFYPNEVTSPDLAASEPHEQAVASPA